MKEEHERFKAEIEQKHRKLEEEERKS